MICKNISRNQLIEEVAKRCDYYKEDVQVMYDALTATNIDHLMEADEQCNISINRRKRASSSYWRNNDSGTRFEVSRPLFERVENSTQC